LPKPKETEFELELPDEQEEVNGSGQQLSQEDSAARDARNAAIAEAAALAEFKRQTQVVQKGLPRPKVVDVERMLKNARDIEDPIERSIADEMALLMANDALKFGGAEVKGHGRPVQVFDEEALQRAQMEVILEMGQDADREKFGVAFEREWEKAHSSTILPGLAGYAEGELDEEQLLTEAFDNVQETMAKSADKGAALEKKLAKLHGGYIERQRKLRAKIREAAEVLENTKLDVEVARNAQVVEEAAVGERLEGLREDVSLVRRREREAQEEYRLRKEELDAMVS
jgi:pre-mRNA-splicing factor CDC5/CEF1